MNDALRSQVEHDRCLSALDELLAHFEAEHGEITAEEVRQATLRARSRAVVARDAR